MFVLFYNDVNKFLVFVFPFLFYLFVQLEMCLAWLIMAFVNEADFKNGPETYVVHCVVILS